MSEIVVEALQSGRLGLSGKDFGVPGFIYATTSAYT
jgi:hypothetical protein